MEKEDITKAAIAEDQDVLRIIANVMKQKLLVLTHADA